MAAQFVFRGRFDERAEFHPEDPARWKKVRRALAGKLAEVVLRKPKSRRSLDMNAYLHCATGPFRLLADHFGEDITGIRYALMGECFGWRFSEKFGAKCRSRLIPRI